jgi:hypothetical protein
MVTYMHAEHKVSIRQSCQATGILRSTYSYRRKPKDDQPMIDGLIELTEKHPAIRFWQCYHRLRAMGHRWNHKRIGSIAAAQYSASLKEAVACKSKAASIPARGAQSGVEVWTSWMTASGMAGAFAC